MVGEWNHTTLGAIASKDGYGLVDGPFGSNLPASCYRESGIPVIRGSNLTIGTNRFVADGFVFVSRETANRLARSLCRPRDIIFTKKGTLGQTGLVPGDGPYDEYLLSSNQMKLTVDPDLADPLYVYYFVSSPESTEKIIRDSEATGVPKTNVTYLRDFPIALPPLPEQRAIAHILGTLDDKIEANRRMSETLEAMARALFKSWFVEFDPVRAKIADRGTGLPNSVERLFPAAFVDSDLGAIPTGWSSRPLKDILTETNERVGDTKVPEYSSTNYGLQPRSERYKKGLSASVAKNKVIRRGSLVFGLSRRVLNFGLMRDSIGSVSAAYRVFTVKENTIAPDLLERFMREHPDYFYRAVSASSREGQSVSVDGLGMLRVVQPSAAIQNEYLRITNTFEARAAALRSESSTFESIRDTLLPTLLTGAVRIGDPQRIAMERVDAARVAES